jgi:DNA-binding transcriptional MerR regulator
MRIADLAAAGGVSTKTIRFYEQAGLLAFPPRTPAGYRDYPSEAAARLRFIRTAQAAGLSLAEIGGVLALRDSGQAPCGHVTALIDAHLATIGRRITQLRTAQDELRQLAGRAAALDPAECTSVEEVCSILRPAGYPTLKNDTGCRHFSSRTMAAS